MRKFLVILAAMALLSGCAAKQVPSVEASADAAAPYSIIFAVPTDATREAFSEEDGPARYLQPDGDYTIVSEVVAGQTAAELIQSRTGRALEDQTTVCMQRFGMPEYQFVWYEQADETLHRAAILEDQAYSYVLEFSVAPKKAATYAACMNAVFSSFGLYTDEWI